MAACLPAAHAQAFPRESRPVPALTPVQEGGGLRSGHGVWGTGREAKGMVGEQFHLDGALQPPKS